MCFKSDKTVCDSFIYDIGSLVDTNVLKTLLKECVSSFGYLGLPKDMFYQNAVDN